MKSLAVDSFGQFRGIGKEDITQHWDELCELLEKPLVRTSAGDYYTADDVLWKCLDETWQCWIAEGPDEIDAVFVTYLTPYPTGFRSFMIYLVGGARIDDWLLTAWLTFKEFAQENGCQEITGAGREGWPRKLKQVESAAFEKLMSFRVRIQ